MSRLVPHGDMTAAEIIQYSYDAMAIVRLCEKTAWDLINRGHNSEHTDAISAALKLALELMAPVHDALERSEGQVSTGGK